MARTKSDKPDSVEPTVDEQTAPAEIEVKSLTEEPVAPAPATPKEEIETDVKKKLTTRTEEENIFIPTSPAVLESAAKKLAEQEGFDLNRGTSIGARLMARARKMV
jgi:hypothetical protein